MLSPPLRGSATLRRLLPTLSSAVSLMFVFAVGLFFYFFVFYKSPPTLLEFLTTDTPRLITDENRIKYELNKSTYNNNLNDNTKNLYDDKQISYTDVKPINLPLTGYDTTFSNPHYKSNDYSVQYHSINGDETNIGDKGFFVKKKNGIMEYMKWTDIPNRSIYFTPGAFRFGPSNYVPSYEDTVYMKYFTQK